MARGDSPDVATRYSSGPVLVVCLVLTLIIEIPSLALTYLSFRRAQPPVELKKAFNLLRATLLLWTAGMFILTISWAVYIGDATAYKPDMVVRGAAPQISNLAGLFIHLAGAVLVPLLIQVGLTYFAIGLPDRTPGRKSTVLHYGSLAFAGLLAVTTVVAYGMDVSLTINPAQIIYGPRNLVVTIYDAAVLVVALVVLVLSITATKRARAASNVKVSWVFVIASCFYLLQAIYALLVDVGLWTLPTRGTKHWISVLDIGLNFGCIMICLCLLYCLGNPSRWRRVESVEAAKEQEAK